MIWWYKLDTWEKRAVVSLSTTYASFLAISFIIGILLGDRNMFVGALFFPIAGIIAFGIWTLSKIIIHDNEDK